MLLVSMAAPRIELQPPTFNNKKVSIPLPFQEGTAHRVLHEAFHRLDADKTLRSGCDQTVKSICVVSRVLLGDLRWVKGFEGYFKGTRSFM